MQKSTSDFVTAGFEIIARQKFGRPESYINRHFRV